jgi:hypothetical protein
MTMAAEEHPDPTGAEKPETPKAHVDGDAPTERPTLRSVEGGRSLADRTKEGEGAAGTQEEMFEHGALDGDPDVTPLKGLFKKSHQFRYKSKLAGTRIDMRGQGMTKPDGHSNIAVTKRLRKIEMVPEFNDRDEVIGWDVVQVFSPTYVQSIGEVGAPSAETGS